MSDHGFPELSRPQPRDLAAAVERLRGAVLTAEPGTAWNYHNPNYHVAARVIEAVGHESFGDYLEAHVLAPIGMRATHSALFLDDARVSRGRIAAFGRWFARDALPHFVGGSGGLVSTARDLARWLLVHANGGVTQDGTRLVTHELLRASYEPTPVAGEYALGWMRETLPDGTTRIEHGGSLFTYSSHVSLLLEPRIGVVVLFDSCSVGGAEQRSFVDGLHAIVRGEVPELGEHTSRTADIVVVFVALAVVFACVRGIRRARAWALRPRPRPRLVLAFAPAMGGIVFAVFLPQLASALFGGRDVTWTTTSYGWPVLGVAAIVTGLASAMLVLARARALR
jgi:CubicO group peptidase (beta-lactamase class C family)